uniref:Uncharacterized protein n=1 Tax=Uncultured archaeon GZfos26G2 TaxID=3386331 RepID=Q64AA8_UNCAG|nr:hypothetical protein GZ32E7_32 [uncultured archaeon GZfos32E7]
MQDTSQTCIMYVSGILHQPSIRFFFFTFMTFPFSFNRNSSRSLSAFDVFGLQLLPQAPHSTSQSNSMLYQLASAYGVPQWGQILTATSKKAFFCSMC